MSETQPLHESLRRSLKEGGWYIAGRGANGMYERWSDAEGPDIIVPLEPAAGDYTELLERAEVTWHNVIAGIHSELPNYYPAGLVVTPKLADELKRRGWREPAETQDRGKSEKPVCSKCDMRISMWDWWGENVDIRWVHQRECPRYQGLQRPKAPPETINTIEQLQALPNGTALRDNHQRIAEIKDWGYEGSNRFISWTGTDLTEDLDGDYLSAGDILPAIVLWRPEVVQ